MKRVCLIISLFAILQADLSYGQQRTYRTVQDLLRDCEGAQTLSAGKVPRQDAWPMYCVGLIEAMAAMLTMNCEYRKEGVLIPSTNSMDGSHPNAAMIQAVINWARANPHEWRTPAVVGINRALAESFPCPH